MSNETSNEKTELEAVARMKALLEKHREAIGHHMGVVQQSRELLKGHPAGAKRDRQDDLVEAVWFLLNLMAATFDESEAALRGSENDA